MTEPIIQAKHLVKHYIDVIAVNDISFTLHAGEFIGVLGPNGAGKTTTLRMLLGLIAPTSGELEVLSYTLPQQARAMRNFVGVVPQLDNLDPDFSVVENLRIYARYFGLRGDVVEQRIKELLNFADLTHKAAAKVTVLSGGMKRRLTLARALINKPRLLILDEPSTGLDPQARQAIWQRLLELRATGTSVVLTTHYMDEAERLCDRLLIVDHGRILSQGAPKDLIREHIEPQVFEIHGEISSGLLQQINQLPAVRTEKVGVTLFVYSSDDAAVLALLQATPNLEFLHRPANLEDVFLKLTGRELRDA